MHSVRDEGVLLVGQAWNENCNSEPPLFNQEGENRRVQIGCNLELLSISENFLPHCKLPAVVLPLHLIVELIGEPLAQNWCGWHQEGEIALVYARDPHTHPQ
jgi:hypothetical protein